MIDTRPEMCGELISAILILNTDCFGIFFQFEKIMEYFYVGN
jgi:hypothetical protein